MTATPHPATLPLLLAAALTMVHAGAARAQQSTITQWNFNGPANDASASTGTTSPSFGAGILTLTGGVTNTFAAGSPGDANPTDNSGLNTTNYPTQGMNSGAAGAQYAVSTAGFSQIQLTLDFRQSATASRYFQLLVSADGSNFAPPASGTASIAGPINNPNTGTSFSNTGLYTNNSGSGAQTFVQGLTFTFPTGSGFENDASFAFRFVSVFDPSNNTGYTAANTGVTYSTAGTARFDLVTVSGVAAVPEPSTYAMIGGGLGLLVFAQRVRRRSTRA